MNVTFVCNEYPPRPQGGIGTFVYYMAHALSSAGHRVTVAGVSDSDTETTDSGVRVITRALSGKRFGYRERRRFRDWLRGDVQRQGTEILEIPEYDGMLPFGFDACSVVIRLHQSASAIALKKGRVPWPSTYYYERQTLAHHRNWIGVSHSVLSSTQRFFSVRPRKAAVLYNFAPPRNYSSAIQSDDIRERHGEYILFVGKLTETKGALTLAQAGCDFLRAYPRLRLVYLGPDTAMRGAQASDLIRSILGPELASRLVFLGRKPHEEVMAWMSAATAVASPSRLEACPLTVIEAFQCGAPVIFSKHPPGPELIEDGLTGLLVDPKKPSEISAAIRKIMDQPDWAAEVAKRAQHRAAEKFSLHRCVEDSMQFYQDVMSGAPNAHSTERF